MRALMRLQKHNATFRYWEMLFGIGGWVPTGQNWVKQWTEDFQVLL